MLPVIFLLSHSMCIHLETSQIDELTADLIVSTMPMKLHTDIPIYTCSNFLHDAEIEQILMLLSKEEHPSKRLQQLGQFFDEQLFFTEMDFTSDRDVIRFYATDSWKQAAVMKNSMTKS